MEEMQKNDEIEINLSELFMTLWKKKWIILLSGIFFALLMGIISQFIITKKYISK